MQGSNAWRMSTAVFALLFCAGCASVKITIPKYSVPTPQAPGRFLAGAAKVEITPPPGYPLGGHSIAGRIARGYWTRLYARSFVFQDAQGRSVALVSCELFAIPAGLHAEVARLVASEHHVPLGPEALILAATHTHHGPAGYMSSATYNWGGPLPGFDGALFHFLAERIAKAVGDAWQDARSSSGSRHQVILRSGYALDLQRNRAIDAFFRNPQDDIAAVLDASASAGMNCPDGSLRNCPRYLAVDPTLKVLEVLRDGRRIALLVFFAVHPTAMTHDSPLYSSDLTGHAMNLLERDAGKAGRWIAGFFNGAEGDVSPRWSMQNRDDVLRLGERLARSVREVLKSAGAPEEVAEIESSGKAFQAYPRSPDTAGFTPRPEVGVASLGGAEDGRTIFYNYGWHGGVTRGANADDAKIPALERRDIGLLKVLKPFLDSPRSYPREFPVSVARIGNSLRLAALPVEMTTVMGRQLRSRLLAEFGQPFVLVGLANEYLGYTVSREEYAAQNYEGSSTIFGKEEGRVIGELLVKVGRKPEPAPNPVPARKFDAGPKSPLRFGPELFGEPRNVPYEDLEPLMPDAQHRVDDRAPRFQWEEDAGTDWATDKRRVAILGRDGSVADDDSGPNLLTVLVDGTSTAGKRTWTAIWLAPGESAGGAEYLFRVETPDGGPPVCSQPFRLGKPIVKVPMPPQPRAGSCPSDRSEP
ncbi:MAG: neutral/alkaline non-lysosomal ceramidase N-terminal domain-containing protein [Bryobacteraceae bacterium]